MKNKPASSQRVNLRKSHPLLHRSIRVIAVGCLAWALNFWGLGFIPPPAFDPYDIDKNLVGVVFAVVGVSLLTFLIFVHSLRWLRISLASAVFWLIVWAGANTHQFFNGKASLQLPIAFIVIAFLCRPLVAEAPVNPFTEEK